MRRSALITASCLALAVLCLVFGRWTHLAHATPRTIPTATRTVSTAGDWTGKDTTLAGAWAPLTQVALVDSALMLTTLHSLNAQMAVIGPLSIALHSDTTTATAAASKSESSYVHAYPPASLTHVRGTTVDTLYWLKDWRSFAAGNARLPIRGYSIWRRRTFPDSVWKFVDTTATTVTSYATSGLATTTGYKFRVAVIDSAGVTNLRAYTGWEDSVVTGAATATLKPYRVTVDTTSWKPGGNTYVTYTIGVKCSNLTGIAATAHLGIDSTFNRIIDTTVATEWKPMVHTAGTDSFVTTFKLNAGAWDARGWQGTSWYISLPTGASSTLRFPATGFCTTNANNRIKDKSSRRWVMDPGDSTWQRLLANDAAQKITTTGFDAIWAKNGSDSIQNGCDALMPDSLITSTYSKWHTHVDSCLSHVLIGAGAPVLVDSLQADPRTHVTAASGGVMRGWIANQTLSDSAYSGANWKSALDSVYVAQQRGSRNKVLILAPYVDSTRTDFRLYILASYLLAKDGHTFLAFARGDGKPTYYPEGEMNLGRPATTYTTRLQGYQRTGLPGAGLYKRVFLNALVLVNPHHDSTFTYVVPHGLRTYRLALTGGADARLGGLGAATTSVVTSVTLSPRHAAILFTSPHWRGGR